MSFSLVPDLLVDSLTDLTLDRLRELEISFLMLDFDNTIVPYTHRPAHAGDGAVAGRNTAFRCGHLCGFKQQAHTGG